MSIFVEPFALLEPVICLQESRKVSANLVMCRGWWAHLFGEWLAGRPTEEPQRRRFWDSAGQSLGSGPRDQRFKSSRPGRLFLGYSRDMGNSFGPNGLSIRLESAGLIVEIPQVVIHEGHQPEVIVGLSDADLLFGKNRADVDCPPLVAHAAGDHSCPVVTRVLELLESAIGARGRAVPAPDVSMSSALMRCGRSWL